VKSPVLDLNHHSWNWSFWTSALYQSSGFLRVWSSCSHGSFLELSKGAKNAL